MANLRKNALLAGYFSVVGFKVSEFSGCLIFNKFQAFSRNF